MPDQEELNYQFNEAVSNEDFSGAERFLSVGADINAPDDNDSSTALCWAARRGSLRMVRLLLRGGADVNLPDNGERTPFYWAVRSGDAKIINLLVERGAGKCDMHYGENDDTLLMIAVRKGDLGVVKALGSEHLDAQNAMGLTVVHIAILGKEYEILNYLLSIGAVDDYVDEKGLTPLTLAAKRGDVQAIEVLCRSAAKYEGPFRRSLDEFVNDRSGGLTALRVAVDAKQTAAVAALLSHGADPTADDR
jgi:ankyrin repeat protein